MNLKQNHWYPGHMNKAITAIHEKIKWIDLLIIVVDARAIFSCIDLPLVTQKPILYVVTKADIADPDITQTWFQHLKANQQSAVLSMGKVPTSRGAILKALEKLGEPLWLKQEKKGVKRQALKIMITGVPNVGKSTLINLLAKQHRVNTENRPGSTRGQQWIKLDEHLLLLDTPGILPPRFQTQETSLQLALIGSMPLKQLPIDQLAYYLYDWMMKQYPQAMEAMHGSHPASAQAFFNQIGKKRGWSKQDVVDYQLVFTHFIKDFQDGKLGRFSLPRVSHEAKS